MVLLKYGKNDGIALYVPKKTTLKEVAAKIEKVKSAFFFNQVREFSNSLVLMNFSLKSWGKLDL
jgi:hypothetical protein